MAGPRGTEEGDAIFGVISGHENDPGTSALALRLMGAVHRLVLRGDAPELAAHYPSAGGAPHEPVRAFRATLRDHVDELRVLVDEPVQTNEPARCAALLGGFLEVARRTGRRLRLLEVGERGPEPTLTTAIGTSSVGGRGARRAPRSCCAARWTGGRRSTNPFPGLAAGCDPRPIDPASEEGQLTLASYIWADQPERLPRIRAACRVAQRVPATVDRASAAEWIEARLREPGDDAATVVLHSIVTQYLDDTERERFIAALHSAGGRASRSAPLAWLRMEPAGELTDISLTVWPGGEERRLARAGYHGDPVLWH